MTANVAVETKVARKQWNCIFVVLEEKKQTVNQVNQDVYI